MENNPISPPTQETPVGQPIPQMAPKPTSRFGLLFLTLVILGIIFLGGTYAFITMQKNTTAPTPITNKTVETQSNLHKLDEQLQSVDTNNGDSDFTQVDQELKNL